MIYKMIYKDVTKALPDYVTAQCISNDCAMGSGVVLAFRKVFPGLKAACINYIDIAKKDVSKITADGTDCRFVNNRGIYIPYRHKDDAGVVYNMFTKDRYWHKAGKGITYESYLANLKDSLEAIRCMMIQNNETKLAMPKIASGRDKCKWEDVELIIKEVFMDTDFEIIICDYTE
ncbi:hypothetical protein [Lacrimispora amygdalina]|uniref:hypothetical protein n=1 Tax=Lacrimispora amygdalina TaxID=253257 RepID=UPI000BE284DE|nr:hypothetical protein [Lacrimispora amygdalina]